MRISDWSSDVCSSDLRQFRPPRHRRRGRRPPDAGLQGTGRKSDRDARLMARVDEQPPVDSPAVRVIAMPADTNPYGDIFGGWLMSLMESAAGYVAARPSPGPAVTLAVAESGRATGRGRVCT